MTVISVRSGAIICARSAIYVITGVRSGIVS